MLTLTSFPKMASPMSEAFSEDDGPASKLPRLDLDEKKDSSASCCEEPVQPTDQPLENKPNETSPCCSSSQQTGSASWSMAETDVGITEYISDHSGFHGVIKQRYSDFLVNEIDERGEIVRLTDTSIPDNQVEIFEDDALSEDVKVQLTQLVESGDKTKHVDIEVGDDKAKRTAVHQAIRRLYTGLFSATEEIAGRKVIRVGYNEGTFSGRSGADSAKNQWPKKLGNYCRFVLYKEGKDTLDSISTVARFLHLKPNMFGYAGTKDKRAKTSQLVTSYKIMPAKLVELNKSLSGVVLGNFSFTKHNIKLGDLSGNHFSIVLRNTDCCEKQVETAMKSLETVGLINYYGMQRFGTTSVPTHEIGKALLHSQWETAVDLIMKPRADDKDSIGECRRVWQETHNPRAALKSLGRQCVERHLLEGLARNHKKDFLSAIQQIPRNARMMYVHSFQSYVWNNMVSRRIRELGHKPIIGDLVLKEIDDIKVKPSPLTEEDLHSYSIHDVVLPLPGYNVVYPSNQVADWYKQMISDAGLDLEMKHKIKDFSLPGDYRRIIVRPRHVSWQIFRYNDHSIPLVRSDRDIMNNEPEPVDVPDGKYQAVKMEFSLPPSTYATMALREVMKIDTSAAYQKTLNVTDGSDDKVDNVKGDVVEEDEGADS